MWARRAMGVAGGQLLETIPCMAPSAAAESWLLLLSLLLAFNCCRESHTGDWFQYMPSVTPITLSVHHTFLRCCPGPPVCPYPCSAAGFPPFLPTSSCKQTIGSFRMESGGRVQ
ncbi:unnamed protein product [Staurois parvus]|uniref:Uncharacterized protein n=1 Tax=Staurois parvus TaxID=386267 RepID=A0ABN9CXL3_9NEOB|nr:unnamed protein product [Staurois parvus]